MKRFNFELQTVLDVAVDTKNLKQSEFITAQQILKSQLEIIDEIKKEICKYNGIKSGKVIDLRVAQRYVETLNQKLSMEENNLLIFQEALKVKETELLEMYKKVKLLEKLKSNKKTIHEEILTKEENKVLDELGKLSWQYRQRNIN